eukprot:Hpha_TRINITY_DN15257_c0_g1::TRINITY_DN15257_c0_g1_i3::g.65124::m.65124
MAEGGGMVDMEPFNGLRGLCALMIFVGHQTDIFLTSPFKGQAVVVGLEYLQAVTLFFILSGIPLARLYSSTGKVRTWAGTWVFWRKRAARLFPIYYLTLVLSLAVLVMTVSVLDWRVVLVTLAGCSVFLEAWLLSMVYLAGPLWQVAVFVYGYVLFPFVAPRVSRWSLGGLVCGILALWAVSTAVWIMVMTRYPDGMERGMGLYSWHCLAVTRLPHILAGVLLGEAVERKRADATRDCAWWGVLTDVLSLLLLVTAVQAPVVEWFKPAKDGDFPVRGEVSIGLEALLVPLHCLWLAGMVLSHPSDLPPATEPRVCWTRGALSARPLLAVGEVSLCLYCIHCVVLQFYGGAYAYFTTGSPYLTSSFTDFAFRVKVPWYHAPVQWVLVVGLSFAVSKWFEAPARRMLAGGGAKVVADAEASALLSAESGAGVYGAVP